MYDAIRVRDQVEKDAKRTGLRPDPDTNTAGGVRSATGRIRRPVVAERLIMNRHPGRTSTALLLCDAIPQASRLALPDPNQGGRDCKPAQKYGPRDRRMLLASRIKNRGMMILELYHRSSPIRRRSHVWARQITPRTRSTATIGGLDLITNLITGSLTHSLEWKSHSLIQSIS